MSRAAPPSPAAAARRGRPRRSREGFRRSIAAMRVSVRSWTGRTGWLLADPESRDHPQDLQGLAEVIDEVVAAALDHACLRDRVVEARVAYQFFGRAFQLVVRRSAIHRAAGAGFLPIESGYSSDSALYSECAPIGRIEYRARY